MKNLLFILLLASSLFAVQNVYDSKDITQINNKLYNKHSKTLISGTINAYFKSGKIQESIPCTNGIPHGTATEYNEEGTIITKRVYKDGIVTSITHF
jgi:antitoxin component YwqK of YwqJK toxin-antitoxin module